MIDYIVIETVVAFLAVLAATAYLAYRAGDSNGANRTLSQVDVALDKLAGRRVGGYLRMSDSLKGTTLNAHEHQALVMGILDARNEIFKLKPLLRRRAGISYKDDSPESPVCRSAHQ